MIDTPGFDDTNRSDTEVLREIATWLTDSYANGIKLHGILYLHRITDVRMQGSARKNLFMFKKLCGPNALKNVFLVTTMWEKVDFSEGCRRESQLVDTEEFWGWMKAQGSHIVRHQNNEDSARKILEQLMSSHSKVVLNIQQQMVEEKRTLDKTDAGIELESEIARERARWSENLRLVKEDMEQAIRDRDMLAQEEIRKMESEYGNRLERLEQERNELKISMEKLHEEKYRKLAEKMEQRQRAHELELQEVREHSAMQLAEVRAQLEAHRIRSPSVGSCIPRTFEQYKDNIKGSVSLAISGGFYFFKGPEYHRW